jgi:Transposase, Mutator family
MADRPRMTAAQLADKLLADEHPDVLRESAAWMAAELMPGRGRRAGRRRARRAHPTAGDAPQRLPAPHLGHPGRRARAGDPQAAPRLLLPLVPGAPPARRAGPGRGGPGGLRQRGVHPQGGPAGRAAGRHRPVQGPGVQALPRPGRAGQRVPRAAAGGLLPVPVAGRQGRTGPRARRGAPQGAGDRLRGPPQRPPRGHRPGRGRGRDPGAFWREFLRSLRARGLAGVRLCVSDAHEGLKQAIAKVLGCPWQRSSVQNPGRREGPARHLRRRERTLAA